MTVRLIPIMLIFACLSFAHGEAVKPPASATDSNKTDLTVPVFDAISPSLADTAHFQPGDSIFIFDGKLFYRARANGKDFFISRSDLLLHADSLVVYQNYRLPALSSTTPSADTSTLKIERQRCTMITKNGSRCKRLATVGSNRCWQHKK